MPSDYVHGYSAREAARLVDQASTLSELLHAGTRYPPGSRVLEAGCGVGAQTLALATNSPGARFTCVDVSPESLAAARARARRRRPLGLATSDQRGRHGVSRGIHLGTFARNAS
jgi:methylase of polypeptide subunit release factors